MTEKLNSMGFNGPPADTRIVVAMSGGVDSSVTAALLAEQGYEVIGVTLQLYDHGAAISRKGACCAGQDIHDAGRVAAAIGIPHYVLDYEDRFRADVMEDFADSYMRGETPIPCVACNQTVKFRDLLAMARDLGADAMATGHYVRRVMGPGGAELHRARDPDKDQSYFLFATTRDQLDFLRFPLGDMTKTETRALAARFNLPVADKPDSQDICFVPNGDYVSVVEKLRPGAADPGEIVDMDGKVLGTHRGIIGFTIGQRKGLGIGGRPAADGSDTEPMFVIALEPDTRRVIVGPRAALACTEVTLDRVNWLDGGVATDGQTSIKLRSTQHAVAARVRRATDGSASITLDAPEFGISAGQAGVIYDGERVLGGGWITARPMQVPVHRPATAEVS